MAHCSELFRYTSIVEDPFIYRNGYLFSGSIFVSLGPRGDFEACRRAIRECRHIHRERWRAPTTILEGRYQSFVMSRKKRTLESLFLLSTLLIVVIAVVFYVVVPPFTSIEYTTIVSAEATAPKIIPPVVHITTPVPVKAIYMSQCLASDRSLRAKLVDLVNHTELNTLVIDIKDYGGKISFPTDNPMLKERVSTTCFASDMMEFIDAVHRDGIYVVGRVTVFQD